MVELVTEPDPLPGPGEVSVRTRAMATDAKRAHELIESGKPMGKILLKP